MRSRRHHSEAVTLPLLYTAAPPPPTRCSWRILGSKIKDSSSLPSSAQGFPTDMNKLAKLPSEETGVSDAAGSLPLGLGEDSINASSVFAMPMLASRTRGFRPTLFDRPKFIPPRNSGKNYS
ncbi:hypothetical protein ZIOFF_066188 [Zingiber officinale]|uniref:Uncharacterized protein n=1 Tax=Zingiber officinale TaxID=94328 RepID=A0A8J5F2F0_ZINOF|nr:hypothetical protein ZIOFF_066188 [Zingiber officinale]